MGKMGKLRLRKAKTEGERGNEVKNTHQKLKTDPNPGLDLGTALATTLQK
jgi:hypothetical protein